ncbi:MAG: serine/threonine protein kinase [Rhizobacter sp.]|nr:serine/threonine protein kinase [Rhizobacter sp.]
MELDVEVTAMRVFEQALDVPAGEREAWLDALELAPAIRRRVEDLLAAEQPSARFLETRVLPPGAATPVTLPVAGERIGAWRIERPLDAGGMGVVFLARRDDGSYEQQVAIKFVRIADAFLSADRRSDLLARFANERRVLARLEHPNIVRILDGGSTDAGVPYLVMEYVDGVALNNWCDRHHLDIAARVELVARVCDGVQAAHRHLIVHRDLKPQNILVGSDGEPRVLDFGIARVAHHHENEGDIAGGSPYYMSPEQVKHQPVDRRCDVFSLGVVLYELLTGTRPFRGASLKEITDAVVSFEPPKAHEVDPSVPKALSEIAARAMEKNPEDRYRSARALSRELRHWLEEHAQESAEPAEDTTPAARRPVVWALAGVAALAVAAAAWWGLAPHEASTADTQAAAAPVAAPAPVPVSVPEPQASGVATSVVAASGALELAPAAGASATAAASAPAAIDTAPAAAPTVATAAPVADAPAPKVTAKAVHKETLKERRAREAREREARQAAAARAATGVLRVAVSPWGNVEVDGKPVGTAPPLNELTLPEGRHTVTIRNAEFPAFTSTVTVVPGQPVFVKHRFGS